MPDDPLPSPADTAAPPPVAPAEPMATAAPDVARAESQAEPLADAGAATPPPADDATPAPKASELSPAACGARLAELFPALFLAPGAPGPVKPIKLRIHADIQARAPGVFSKRVLGLFFSRYTTTNAYLKALTLAPQRFDLDGQPAGEISDEHRGLAAEELARRHALAAERRAAQRPAPRSDTPAAEGQAPPIARREARGARAVGPRREARPDAGPAARPPQPQPPHESQGRRPERAAGARPSSGSARSPRHPERPPQAHETQEAAAPAALPTDPAQRERAMLLRSFESSPLSKANFCALKGITEAALDAALAQAQAERGAPSNAPARPGSGKR